jgi:hypothetical protein
MKGDCVTWLAVGLAVGLACGGMLGVLMTWWSSKRIEREASRQYEIGIAEGMEIAQREQQGKAARAKSTRARKRRRDALAKAEQAGV